MKQILVANDLSARSDRALRRAVALAKAFGAKLEVLTVIEETFLEAATQQNETFTRQAIAQQIAGIAEASGVAIDQNVVVGLDYEDIIQRSEDLDADVVVIGIHRHKTPQLFWGTTAERVLRYGRRPVLIVKTPVGGPYRKVVVASDLSTHAEVAAGMAARLAPAGEVTLLHAVHRPFAAFFGKADQDALMAIHQERVRTGLGDQINRLSAELGDRAPGFDISMVEGEPIGVIRQEVERVKPDLLAVGTHSRTGLGHALIGSVAEEIMVEFPVDVLAAKSDR